MVPEAVDYIAIIAIPGGLALALWGIRWATRHLRRQRRDPWRALVLMQAFRIVLIGLCLAALGAGLWWRENAVVVLAAIIFGEEMLESGVFLAALRNDIARRRP